MKIGKKFNTLTLQQYIFYIDNHKKYTDFNTLGLYRSIIENEKLLPDDKITVRDYAHRFFRKSFDFLQLKDPYTFIEVAYLGQEMTKADRERIRDEIRGYQQKVLTAKRIKHRNFGVYSKHDCGYDTCRFNGMMIRQGSFIAESDMYFKGDKRGVAAKVRSNAYRADRKRAQQMIKKELEDE